MYADVLNFGLNRLILRESECNGANFWAAIPTKPIMREMVTPMFDKHIVIVVAVLTQTRDDGPNKSPEILSESPCKDRERQRLYLAMNTSEEHYHIVSPIFYRLRSSRRVRITHSDHKTFADVLSFGLSRLILRESECNGAVFRAAIPAKTRMLEMVTPLFDKHIVIIVAVFTQTRDDGPNKSLEMACESSCKHRGRQRLYLFMNTSEDR
jgi:hypothetical protein